MEELCSGNNQAKLLHLMCSSKDENWRQLAKMSGCDGVVF